MYTAQCMVLVRAWHSRRLCGHAWASKGWSQEGCGGGHGERKAHSCVANGGHALRSWATNGVEYARQRLPGVGMAHCQPEGKQTHQLTRTPHKHKRIHQVTDQGSTWLQQPPWVSGSSTGVEVDVSGASPVPPSSAPGAQVRDHATSRPQSHAGACARERVSAKPAQAARVGVWLAWGGCARPRSVERGKPE